MSAPSNVRNRPLNFYLAKSNIVIDYSEIQLKEGKELKSVKTKSVPNKPIRNPLNYAKKSLISSFPKEKEATRSKEIPM